MRSVRLPPRYEHREDVAAIPRELLEASWDRERGKDRSIVRRAIIRLADVAREDGFEESGGPRRPDMRFFVYAEIREFQVTHVDPDDYDLAACWLRDEHDGGDWPSLSRVVGFAMVHALAAVDPRFAAAIQRPVVRPPYHDLWTPPSPVVDPVPVEELRDLFRRLAC
jgi:hypothetical protein